MLGTGGVESSVLVCVNRFCKRGEYRSLAGLHTPTKVVHSRARWRWARCSISLNLTRLAWTSTAQASSETATCDCGRSFSIIKSSFENCAHLARHGSCLLEAQDSDMPRNRTRVQALPLRSLERCRARGRGAGGWAGLQALASMEPLLRAPPHSPPAPPSEVPVTKETEETEPEHPP